MFFATRREAAYYRNRHSPEFRKELRVVPATVTRPIWEDVGKGIVSHWERVSGYTVTLNR